MNQLRFRYLDELVSEHKLAVQNIMLHVYSRDYLITGHEMYDNYGLNSNYVHDTTIDLRLSAIRDELLILRGLIEEEKSNLNTLSAAFVGTITTLKSQTLEQLSSLDEMAATRIFAENLRNRTVEDERIARMVEDAQRTATIAETSANWFESIPAIGDALSAAAKTANAAVFVATLYDALAPRKQLGHLTAWSEGMVHQYYSLLSDALVYENASSEVFDASHQLNFVSQILASQFVQTDQIERFFTDHPQVVFDLSATVDVWMAKRTVSLTAPHLPPFGMLEPSDLLLRFKWPMTYGNINSDVHTFEEMVFLVYISTSRSYSEPLSFEFGHIVYDVIYDSVTRTTSRSVHYDDWERDIDMSRMHKIGTYPNLTTECVIESVLECLDSLSIPSYEVMKVYRSIVTFSSSRMPYSFHSDFPEWDTSKTRSILSSYHTAKKFGDYLAEGSHYITTNELLRIIGLGGFDSSGYNSSFVDIITDYEVHRALTSVDIREATLLVKNRFNGAQYEVHKSADSENSSLERGIKQLS